MSISGGKALAKAERTIWKVRIWASFPILVREAKVRLRDPSDESFSLSRQFLSLNSVKSPPCWCSKTCISWCSFAIFNFFFSHTGSSGGRAGGEVMFHQQPPSPLNLGCHSPFAPPSSPLREPITSSHSVLVRLDVLCPEWRARWIELCRHRWSTFGFASSPCIFRTDWYSVGRLPHAMNMRIREHTLCWI